MRFFPRLFGRKGHEPVRQVKSGSVDPPFNTASAGALIPFFQQPEVTPYVAWNLYKSVATLAKVVDLTADEMARLKPVVKVNGEADFDHPLNQLLRKPGYGRTRRSLIKELGVQQLVSGTAYLHAIGQLNREPVALDVVKSHYVNPVQGADMWPSMYIYAEGSRHVNFERDGAIDLRYTDGRLNEVIPIIEMSGDRRGVGLSRLSAVRSDVELRLKGVKHNSNMMDKGATASVAAIFKDNLTPEQAHDVAASLNEQMGGWQNAGRIAVLSGGDASFEKLTTSNKDMDWTNLAKLTDDAIVSRYNVPVTLFNVAAQTNNNFETAWYMLYEIAVLPLFETIYSGIARLASDRYGEEIEIEHDALSSNILAKQAVERATKLYQANLCTRDEAREEFGYEPTIGGNTFYQSAGLIPSGYDYFTDHGSPPADVAAALGLDKQPGSDPVAPDYLALPAPAAKPDGDGKDIGSTNDDDKKSAGRGRGKPRVAAMLN